MVSSNSASSSKLGQTAPSRSARMWARTRWLTGGSVTSRAWPMSANPSSSHGGGQVSVCRA